MEKPVIKKVYRTKYVRNPLEIAVIGGICFVIGVIVGYFL